MGSASIYSFLAIVGIVGGSVLWNVLLRHRPQHQDRRLVFIYLSALGGAFLGAKLAYMLAEGWLLWPRIAEESDFVLRNWLTGKSITGALLGGYGAVEFTKWMTGYRRATGDLFAVIVPLGLVLGRTGCLITGCCPGIALDRAWYTVMNDAGAPCWPAVPAELAFNALLALVLAAFWRKHWLEGQLFHIYLIAYGLFRFGHEFLRDTPRLAGGISGYQVIALAIAGFGAWRYVQRAQRGEAATTPKS